MSAVINVDGIFWIASGCSILLNAGVDPSVVSAKELHSALVKADYARRHPAVIDAQCGGNNLINDYGEISFDQLLTLLEVHERTLTTKRARAAMIRSERKVFNQNRDRLALAMIEAGQEYVCAICKSPGDLTIDHIVPLSAGGQDELDNLRFLCRVCNSRKGNRHETTQ